MNSKLKVGVLATLAGCSALALAACLSSRPVEPETWTLRVRTVMKMGSNGIPVTTVGSLVGGDWAFSIQAMTVGTATIWNSTASNSQAYAYCIDCVVPAVWYVEYRSGPCFGVLGATGTFFLHSSPDLVCQIGTDGFYSTDSYGSTAQYIPLEYWDQTFEAPPGPGDAESLSPDARLYPDWEVWSESGQYRLLYQQDGNLVIYDTWAGDAIWASNTVNTSPGRTIMQLDGNLVIYDANDQPVWATGTVGNNGAYASLLNDGLLVVFSSSGLPLWWSGS